MKRILMSILLAFVVVGSICLLPEIAAAEAAKYDFKTFYWGDSREKVITVEGVPDGTGTLSGTTSEYIAYETTAVGMDVLLAYYFCDEGLYAVRYVLLETHSNDSLYIDDYNEFKSALTKKYGDPIFDLENWENNSKKEYYANKKGDALCYGYLTYKTLYSSGSASIVMSMSADNYEISTTIDYVSFEINPGETDYSNEV